MYRLAVIGCGIRMNALWRQKPSWLDSEVEIAALYDIDPNAMHTFRENRAPHARCCASPEEIFQDPSIGWLMIATPNATHAEIIIRAFEAGKNVYAEKPLAISQEECIRIWHAWKKSGKRFMIGFTLRYSPHYRKIAEIVQSGLLGKIVSMEFNENVPPEHGGHIISCWRGMRASTGCHILEKCCHDMDIANAIIGAYPVQVASFGGLSIFVPENEDLLEKAKDEDGTSVFCRWPTAKGKNPFTKPKDIVDHQVAILKYANGVKATFHTNICAPFNERRMYLAGTCGTLRADAISGELTVRTLDGKEHDFSTGEKGSHSGGDRGLLETLHQEIIGNPCTDASIPEGIASALVCFALDDAMRQNRIVDVAESFRKFSKMTGETL